MLLNLVHPVLDGAETLSVSDVVSNNDSMSTFVIAASNSLESFLACSIPLSYNKSNKEINAYDLEFDCFSIDFNGSNFLL